MVINSVLTFPVRSDYHCLTTGEYPVVSVQGKETKIAHTPMLAVTTHPQNVVSPQTLSPSPLWPQTQLRGVCGQRSVF